MFRLSDSAISSGEGIVPSGDNMRKFWDKSVKGVLFIAAIFGVLTVFFILLFLLKDGIAAFYKFGPTEFIFGSFWNPGGAVPVYGTLPLWVDTILVTIGAMVIAAPPGIAGAIYISEIAHPKVKNVVKPAIELLSGIPSVVFGFFGLIVLTDWLRVTFDVPSGESWLAGSILLGIMALPTIVSVSEDAISAVPKSFKHGSLGLGATNWQTISRVLVPSALSGITAAVILGMGRAIGETMAVMMVTGNAAIIPSPITDVLSPVRTLTGTIGIEMGEVAVGSDHYHALFGVAVILLVITLTVNISAQKILKKINEKHTGTGGKKGKKLNLILLPSEHAFLKIFHDNKNLIVWAVMVIITLLLTGIIPAAVLAVIITAGKFISGKLSPKQSQMIAYGLLYATIGIILLTLAVILFDIFSKGLPAISWEFLTESPRNLGREGGIFPAIVGTVYLVAGAIAMSLPIGIGAAVYMTEYTKEGRLTEIIRSGVDLLNGTPSIVFGLFGFSFLVLFLNFGVSLLAGQITLALMVLPTIIRTTEEALKSVPQSVRHGSLALGSTKWQTIYKVVIPPAIPGIITGTILSIGRAAGETAPILFTAVVFSSRFLPTSELDPVMALPYHLYILSTNVPGATENQYGTAVVLVTIVAVIYLFAIFIRNHYQKSVRW